MIEGLPKYTIKDLMDHGVHFGHQRTRWNPRMKPFIYDTRAGISIIDLRKTLPMLYEAMNKIADVAANNGRILFVSTKEYISDQVQQAAQDCAQFYVNYRWLGGTLTNWNTIVKSIDKMQDMRDQLQNQADVLTKKERSLIELKIKKLERFLRGIENMKYLPDLLVVLDVYRDCIAIKEANKRNIPVVAIVDTNADPGGITHPIPGNDDSRNTIKFYLDCFRDSVLCGIKDHLGKHSMLQDEEPLRDPQVNVAGSVDVNSDDTQVKIGNTQVEVKAETVSQTDVTGSVDVVEPVDVVKPADVTETADVVEPVDVNPDTAQDSVKNKE